MTRKKPPSLLEMCVYKAIDNVKYLGDVGDTDSYLLERILSHCTVNQLRHVENCTKERDLTPVTDKLWKKLYERKFGVANTNMVIERLEERKVAFKWMELYEAKEKEISKAEIISRERIAQRYKDEDAKKQSRQVQLCTKVPPANKRSFFGGGGGYNITNKSNIMKKAKIEFLNSYEVKNLTAMRRNAIKPNYCPVKPGGLSGRNQASSFRGTKPLPERY